MNIQEKKLKVKVISAKLSFAFPKTREGRLFLSIVLFAIKDYGETILHAKSAKSYLNGEIFHAEMCGVESDYIRRVMNNVGIAI